MLLSALHNRLYVVAGLVSGPVNFQATTPFFYRHCSVPFLASVLGKHKQKLLTKSSAALVLSLARSFFACSTSFKKKFYSVVTSVEPLVLVRRIVLDCLIESFDCFSISPSLSVVLGSVKVQIPNKKFSKSP